MKANNRTATRALEFWQTYPPDGEESMCLRTDAVTIGLIGSGRGSAPWIPTIQLRGQWLRALGWEPGELVFVEADRQSIRICRPKGASHGK